MFKIPYNYEIWGENVLRYGIPCNVTPMGNSKHSCVGLIRSEVEFCYDYFTTFRLHVILQVLKLFSTNK